MGIGMFDVLLWAPGVLLVNMIEQRAPGPSVPREIQVTHPVEYRRFHPLFLHGMETKPAFYRTITPPNHMHTPHIHHICTLSATASSPPRSTVCCCYMRQLRAMS